jgi:hypothetical protein
MKASTWILMLAVLTCGFVVSCDSGPTEPPPAPANTVGPEGGTLSFHGGNVMLVFPPSAVSEEVTVTVQPTSTFPADPRIVESAVYRFQPEGIQFSRPVQLAIRYDPAGLQSAMVDSTLRLYEVGAAEWAEVPGSAVDVAARTVTGSITGFSTLGLAAIIRFETSGHSLFWPLWDDDRDKLGQAYAEFDCGAANRYHAGSDIGRPTDEGKPVIAAGGGIVRRIDMNPNDPIEERRDNHCMGHVVIIDHSYGRDPSGPFSLYAHLKRILIRDGRHVERGWQIGEVGNTGSGRCGNFPPHLHFEVKDRNVLGDITDHGDTWGYTPPEGQIGDDPKDPGYLPGNYGYHDPSHWLHDVVSIDAGIAVRVTAEGDGVYLRVGPSEQYRYFWRATSENSPKELRAGDAFVAVSRSAATDNCSRGWYEITNADRREYFPDYALSDRETGLPGWIPTGWVCMGHGDQVWVEEVGPNQPPSVAITSPQDGASFVRGEMITFVGTADDPEDGALTGQALVWRSNVDGELGAGSSVTRSDLSVGDHTITLSATDSHGATSSDTVAITVRAGDEGGPIAIGDTIYGLIEPTGDIDEFTFAGTEGDEVAAFLQTLSGGYFNDLELCLLADAGTADELELGCVRSNGDDTSLWGQSTGRFALPRSTTYTVRVSGVGGDTGPYRFQVYPIDRAPEVQAQALALNDTIEGESIAPPGDIDEFTFAGTEGEEVAGFLQTLSGGYFNDLELCLVADAGTLDELELGCVRSNGDDTSLWGQSTGRFRLPRTTTYTVRVLGVQSAEDQGPYRFMAYLVDRAPEDIAQSVAVGDTIAGESITPPGDIDEFTFSGMAGQVVEVFFQALSGGYFERLELYLLANAGTPSEQQLGSRVLSDGGDTSLEGQSTGPVTLPYTGSYTVRVMGVDSKQGEGAYRFHVRG